MEIKYKIFPYPVLAEYLDDYKNSKFYVMIEQKKHGNNILFYPNYYLNDQKMIEMLNNQELKVIFHFECSKTGYRKVFEANTEKEIKINESKLNGKLQVCSFIIASKNIKNYSNNNFHEDFKGMYFDFDVGSIIAVGNQIDFNIEKDRDEFVNTTSSFSIQKNLDKNETNMLIDLNMNKVCIKIPEESFYMYKNLSLQYELRNLLNSLVIFPALVYILEEIAKLNEEDRYENFSGYGWYNSIKKILNENFSLNLESIDLNNYNLYKLAQELLDSPITDGFRVFSNYFELNEED